jgi:hypothetical protein
MSKYFGTKMDKIKQAEIYGEKDCEEFLIKQGVMVVPTNIASRKGSPLLLGKKYVPLPDKQCFIQPNGKLIQNNFWIEVKDKPQYDRFPQTGFNESQLEYYLEIQEKTDWPVIVVFRDSLEWEERAKQYRKPWSFKNEDGSYAWYGNFLNELIPYGNTHKARDVDVIVFPINKMKKLEELISQLKNQCLLISKGWF